MPFRFIDDTGRERSADGLASLLVLFRQGALDEETLVFDEQEGRWRKAKEITYLASGSVAATPDLIHEAGPQREDDGRMAGVAPEAQVPRALGEPAQLPVSDATLGESPASKIASPGEANRIWRRWTGWFRDDGFCFRAGIGVLAMCGLMFGLLMANLSTVAGSSTQAAARALTGTLGRLLVVGVVMFFLMKRGLGKGRAVLILSSLFFCVLCYFGVVLVVRSATNTKIMSVLLSTMADIASRTQTSTAEIAALKVDSVFEMLDGKRAGSRAELADMLERVGIADRKTAELLNFLEKRIVQARNEISAIDSIANVTLTTEFNALFPYLQRGSSLQRQYFQAIADLLTFLLEESGSYRVTEEGIRFDRELDRKIYDYNVDRVNELSDSINKLKAKYQASQKQP
jgi:hypothetical protein